MRRNDGDDGRFVPSVQDNNEALDFLAESVELDQGVLLCCERRLDS